MTADGSSNGATIVINGINGLHRRLACRCRNCDNRRFLRDGGLDIKPLSKVRPGKHRVSAAAR